MRSTACSCSSTRCSRPPSSKVKLTRPSRRRFVWSERTLCRICSTISGSINKDWTSGLSASSKATKEYLQTISKLTKQKQEKTKELEALESKKEALLEKYNLGYVYEASEAPSELRSLDTKIYNTSEKLSVVINKINYQNTVNQDTDEKYAKTFEVVLEGIEQNELSRLESVQFCMRDFGEAIKQMRIALFDSEQKFMSEVDAFQPKNDIQEYIANRSRYQDLEDILELYRKYGKQSSNV